MARASDEYTVTKWINIREVEKGTGPNGSGVKVKDVNVTMSDKKSGDGYGNTSAGLWIELKVRVPKRLFGPAASVTLDLSTATTEIDAQLIQDDLVKLNQELE